MIDRLPSVSEAIKITFYGPMTMRLNDTTNIIKDGFIKFNAYVLYEVIGSFLQNDRVKVVAKIHQLNCDEFVEEYAMASFQRELQRIITKKFPEAGGRIDVCPITKLINEE